MPAIAHGQQMNDIATVDLGRMIEPDVHRPGVARARLRDAQIPVWAVMGHVGAVAKTTALTSLPDQLITRVAVEFDITPEAVRAALVYYQAHRGAIDALLEANAMAIR